VKSTLQAFEIIQKWKQNLDYSLTTILVRYALNNFNRRPTQTNKYKFFGLLGACLPNDISFASIFIGAGKKMLTMVFLKRNRNHHPQRQVPTDFTFQLLNPHLLQKKIPLQD